MKIKALVFAGAVSVMCGVAMAGDDSAALQLARKTVASKNYVDGTFATKNYADTTFQTKIAATTSGLSDMFGTAGTLLATTGTDGTVQERLVLPGYSNGQSGFGGFLESVVYNNNSIYDLPLAVEDMYRTVTNNTPPPHDPWDSIPSVGFVVDLYDSLRDSLQPKIPGLGVYDAPVVLKPFEPGKLRFSFVVPGFDYDGGFLFGNTVNGYGPLNWALFGGNISNSQLVDMFNDAYQQYIRGHDWDSRNDMTLNDVLFSPASLQLVSDVWKESQREIPAAGYAKAATGAANAVALTSGSGSAATDWLNAAIKGTGLVTKTATEGQIGERKVFEETDYQNYQAANLTANEKNIQKISIPTMGAVMAAVNANTVTLPTGAAGNVVTYDANGAIGGSVAPYTGAATYAPATDSAKIPTMAGVAAYVDAHSPTIPAPTGDCLNAANHCALVTTYANGTITYAWTLMAK